MFKFKQIIIIFCIIVVFATAILFTVSPKKEKPVVNNESDVVQAKPISLCYYDSASQDGKIYDKSWIKLDITGDKVSGEYDIVPAQKDTKIGKFEGTVGPVDQKNMSRRADLWWDTFAEGQNVKEELVVEFGDGSAATGAGEMIDRGDGVYVYKDKNNLSYPSSLSQIDCDTLREKIVVEKYVSDNIQTLTTDKPVLGGSWYILSAVANPSAGTGITTYEDGHIQRTADFIYTYDKSSQAVSLTSFKPRK